MKNNNSGRCPGCGKHCPMANVKCKYGQRYFAKQAEQAGKNVEEKKYKWEKLVERGGLAWSLLAAGKKMKKRLKKKELTEAQLMMRLTEEERDQLSGLLNKLGTALGD
ncbi:MAG: hypothetical protein IJC56_06395 [Clostridia bacterium]|nr:hypothetical protein [Clostridia bacterium]